MWQDDYEKSSFRWNRKAEGGDALLAFTRTAGSQRLLVILNFSDQEVCFTDETADKASLLLDTYEFDSSEKKSMAVSGREIRLMPYEGMLLELND